MELIGATGRSVEPDVRELCFQALGVFAIASYRAEAFITGGKMAGDVVAKHAAGFEDQLLSRLAVLVECFTGIPSSW